MDTVPDRDATPLEVRWRDLADFDQLDERVSAVTVLFGSVIGVNDGTVQWCTDSLPPAESERLAWLWLCWPHLDEQIMDRARPDHQKLMRAYRAGRIREWWSHLGGSAAG
jgi:hypothetical protein